jgi:N-carbamoyl-L-amino-acid hydrolase
VVGPSDDFLEFALSEIDVARSGVPTVMLFVQSLRGLSHTKLEDTRHEHLELAVQALDRLASKAIAWVSDGGGRA